MQIIRQRAVIGSILAVTSILYFSVVMAASNMGHMNGAAHRNAVSTFVQGLLDAADMEQEGIGEQVRVVAQQQNESKERVAEALDKIQNRGRIKTFLIGTDYTHIGKLRSEMVRTGNHMDWLTKLLDKTINEESKTTIQDQIRALGEEQKQIEEFVKANENTFSLFGWVIKSFNN